MERLFFKLKMTTYLCICIEKNEYIYVYMCVYMSIVNCTDRLFYFCAVSIFHYFLKGTCTSLIKSTHSKKKQTSNNNKKSKHNSHSTFLKKVLRRVLDGGHDQKQKVEFITCSNLLL